MLHVASDAAIRALSRSRHPAPQPPQAAQATATPFSSLLDDNAAPPEPTRPPATDDNVASERSGKSSNDKTAKADAADTGKDGKRGVDKGEKIAKKSIEKSPKAAKTDKPDKSEETDQADQPDKTAKTDQNDKVATDAKTAADGVTVAAVASQDAKPSDTGLSDAKPSDDKPSDGKPANLPVPVDVAAAPPVDPTPVIKSPDATVATIAPAIVATPTPASKPIAADAETLAPDAVAAPQSDADKAADDPVLGAKTVAFSHNPAKPQERAADADGEAIAHGRGEATDRNAAAIRTLDALTTDPTTAPKAAADVALAVLPAPSQNSPTAASPVTTAPQAPQAAAIPFSSVAIEIAGKAASGKNHFEIRLDPPELGRIEVHLAVDHDGNVTSRMIADRTDTLDLLRRDASGLERALQDAGLKTSHNGLQFSLRDQSAYQQQQGFAGNDATHIVVEDETLAATDIAQSSYNRLAGIGGGLDIQV